MGSLVRLGSALAVAVALVAPAAAHADVACTRVVEELPVPDPEQFDFYDVWGGSDSGEWVLGRGYHLPSGVVMFAWRNGVPQPELHPSDTVGDINDSGVMAGSAGGVAHRVVNGVRQPLEHAPFARASGARYINNAGDVLGMSGSFSDRGPLVVWPGGSTRPEVLPGTDDGVVRTPMGIDDAGNVIAQEGGPSDPVSGRVWAGDGRSTKLETLPGHVSARPAVISDGRIFGRSTGRFFGENKVVEWGLDGKIVRTVADLGRVQDAGASGQLLGATWISDEVAVATASGEIEVMGEFTVGMVLADNGDVYGAHYAPERHTPLRARCA